jgi:ribosomal protein L16 Arg81 hydroxylase
MDSIGLRALLNVDDPSTFLDDVWPDESFVARGPIERLAGLVDHEFAALCKMRKRMTLACFRTLPGEDVSIRVSDGQERYLYDAGFTLYFIGLRDEHLDRWVSVLEEELGVVRGSTVMSAFASRRGRGLPTHYDHNDNFVVQARGTKRWRLAKNDHVRNPTVGYTLGEKPRPMQIAEAPNGFPGELREHRIVDLDPGAVMFMPRGTWHDTETIEDSSLHFNFECRLATWKDVVEYVLLHTTALHGAGLREPLARGLLDQRRIPIRGRPVEELRAVCDALEAGDVTVEREALHRFIAQRRGG